MALIFGFVLILAVALLTFQRSQESGKQNEAREAEKSEDVAPPAEKKTDFSRISSKDLWRKTARRDKVKIIDTRSRDEYTLEHIIDSVNISLEELSSSQISESKDDYIVIVGSSESGYAEAIKIIKGKNFSNVAVLDGGFSGWKNTIGQTISIGNPKSFVDQAKVTYVLPEALKTLLDTGTKIYFLDVRSVDAYAKEHIVGAVNIPLNELEKRRGEIPENVEIAAYGKSDLQGFQAGVRIYDLNFFTASVIQGGFNAWKEKGFEIAK